MLISELSSLRAEVKLTYNKQLYWHWNLQFGLKSLIDVNFDGVQNDDADNGHD